MVKPAMVKSLISALKPTSPSAPGRTTKVMVLSLPARAMVPLRAVISSAASPGRVTEIWSI